MLIALTPGALTRRLTALLLTGLIFTGCTGTQQQAENTASPTFTLAVIPDTQNYLDYSHQRNEQDQWMRMILPEPDKAHDQQTVQYARQPAIVGQ